MRVTVSQLDTFREWRDDPDQDLPALLARLKGTEVTEPMLRGRAFARCLERAALGSSDTLTADGYTFCFAGEFQIDNLPRREEKREKDYGGVIVPARCDRVIGKLIVDDKTTERGWTSGDGGRAEAYLDKMQWRFYLDMWNADRFQWNIWEVKEATAADLIDEDNNPIFSIPPNSKPMIVRAKHVLESYRYARMQEECYDLAQEFASFARGALGWKD